jgi:hypothetical protein
MKYRLKIVEGKKHYPQYMFKLFPFWCNYRSPSGYMRGLMDLLFNAWPVVYTDEEAAIEFIDNQKAKNQKNRYVSLGES